MSDLDNRDVSSTGPTGRGHRQVPGRLARLMRKELREILRDRRTILTLVIMPLLVYPLLALVFQRFLFNSLSGDRKVEYVIGFESRQTASVFERQLGIGSDAIEEYEEAELSRGGPASGDTDRRMPGNDAPGSSRGPQLKAERPTVRWMLFPPGTAEQYVANASIDLAVVLRQHPDKVVERGLSSPRSWQLYFRTGSPMSEAALRFVESRLRAYNNTHLDEQLKRLGVAAALPATTHRRSVEFAGAPAFSLAALVPLILILTTVTGAVYPAIDLTAGERERGTLETLIAAPVPRLGLLLAKYVAVLTVALLTALVNLIAMTVTAHSTGLSTSLFGEAGISLFVVVKVLMLLALFAAFFSAILLAITSYARSFKEAQAYIIPLMLLCLVPGVICLAPSLEFSGLMAVTPLVNIVILSRDVLEGSADPTLATAAVLSTLLYVVAAIALAARIFGTDAVLYGSQATWADLVRRPTEPQPAAGLPAALLCLSVMFPCYFVASSSLARSPGISMGQRLLVGGLITVLVFGAIPWCMTVFSRARFQRQPWAGRADAVGLLASALLGVAVWPIAHEVFLFNEWLGISVLQSEQTASVKEMLEQWRAVSPALILLSLALVPGVFEEYFFRGVFFASIRGVLSPGRTIVVSALVFGLFHVVAAGALAPERFLPSAFLGLVLGWVRVRSGRLLPCMVLHTFHNGLLLSVVYWREELSARGFGVQEGSQLPAMWLILAVAVSAVAATMLLAATKVPRPSPSTS